jgi:3'-phosphoadenosine 5'-phosphosulfate sulfotransferase (PAPS reductase)/FAD synthetase
MTVKEVFESFIDSNIDYITLDTEVENKENIAITKTVNTVLLKNLKNNIG